MASAYQLAMVSNGREVAGALAEGLSRQELATLGMAALIRQQIKAGEAGDVVKLGVAIGAVQPASSGDGAGAVSPLADAFGRLPGAVGAPQAHQSSEDAGQDGANAGDAGQWPADCESAGRLDRLLDRARWRGPLLLDLEPVEPVEPVEAGRSAAGGELPPPTPTPPAGPARQGIHPDGSDFDFLKKQAVG